MKRPKISVVLCTYNGEKYITQQIESILNQSILPDELIISDDCSSDSSVEIVSNFASKHPATVRFIQGDKNLGFIKNFEKAISLADGEVIFLSDQDDVWSANKIETMLLLFIDHENVGLVYSDAILTDSELEPTGRTLFESRKSLMLNKPRTAPMLIKEVGINGCTMAFRSNLKELVFPIGEGWGHDHWIAFIAHTVMDVTPVCQSLMYYRRHEDSAGNDPLLEGGRVKAWLVGINRVSVNEYRRDLCRWQVMFQRLHEIEEKRSMTWINYTNLDVYLRECGRRTELAQLRMRMKKKGRLNRFSDIFDIFSSGSYHQYLHGMKSLAKDLLAR